MTANLVIVFFQAPLSIDGVALAAKGILTSPKAHLAPPRKKSLKCTHCHKDGHTIDRCYFLHRFPPGSRKTGTNYKSRAHQVSSATNTPSTSSLPFTIDQCRQLLTLLNNATYSSSMATHVSNTEHLLSGLKDLPHYENAISRGAFAAVKRKIFVTCSAGNSGPYPYSVENTAPWITTVGAGSIDRAFPVLVQLGNGKAYVGSSLYTSNFTSRKIPLKYLGDCCFIDTLHGNVKGKIVVCTSEYNSFDIGFVVQEAGGVGLIQLNSRNLGEDLRAVAFTVPAAAVGFKEGLEIITYIHTTEYPTASFRFYNLSVIGKNRAPAVASFSSRGPNFIIPEILKPDLLAPGINILAAFVPNLAPSGSPYDPRRVDFNLLSGTSMACPNLAPSGSPYKP
ncbi:hypothetical protein F0562_006510 [Nyssa sinensis]|uniref:Uncharacterized protein n=1 Tax=Nyssa sinensis TaxID=561372 RepID=A0A5J5ALB6_9ASTE|nr:hypothetical protein F0562_006510 [Nyssa sinensis]